MQGLSSSSCPSQNELHLTYNLSPTIQPAKENFLTIKLVFLPDTRQLATVDLSGPAVEGSDFRELIDTYLQSNDVHGLISAILARARRSWVGLFLMHMFVWVFAWSLLWRSVIFGSSSRWRILTFTSKSISRQKKQNFCEKNRVHGIPRRYKFGEFSNTCPVSWSARNKLTPGTELANSALKRAWNGTSCRFLALWGPKMVTTYWTVACATLTFLASTRPTWALNNGIAKFPSKPLSASLSHGWPHFFFISPWVQQ